MVRRIVIATALAFVAAALAAPAAMAGNVGWSVSLGAPGFGVTFGQPGWAGWSYMPARPWVAPVRAYWGPSAPVVVRPRPVFVARSVVIPAPRRVVWVPRAIVRPVVIPAPRPW